MPPLTPAIDPELLHERWLAQLSPEMRELHDALQGCRNLAERLVLIGSTRFGLPGVACYCRYAKHDRKQFRDAAAALQAVGLADEAALCRLVAPSKPKPPLPWRQRQHKRMMERVRMLRAKGWPHFKSKFDMGLHQSNQTNNWFEKTV